MKILVTGGCDFIATHVTEALSGEENEVFNYSLHPPLRSKERQHRQQGDILNAAALQGAFENFRARLKLLSKSQMAGEF